MPAIDTSIDTRSTLDRHSVDISVATRSTVGRHVERYMVDTRPTTGDSRSSVDQLMCRAIVFLARLLVGRYAVDAQPILLLTLGWHSICRHSVDIAVATRSTFKTLNKPVIFFWTADHRCVSNKEVKFKWICSLSRDLVSVVRIRGRSVL